MANKTKIRPLDGFLFVYLTDKQKSCYMMGIINPIYCYYETEYFKFSKESFS